MTLTEDGWEGVPFEITNMKVFLCRRGLNHWGTNAIIDRLEAHDVLRGGVIFGATLFQNSLVVGHTPNGHVMGGAL